MSEIDWLHVGTGEVSAEVVRESVKPADLPSRQSLTLVIQGGLLKKSNDVELPLQDVVVSGRLVPMV